MRNEQDARVRAKAKQQFYQREERCCARKALAWQSDGDDWILLAGRRRLGRVVPDPKYPGMWRSVKSGGQLSDTANLSWAKSAVPIAAERARMGGSQPSCKRPRKSPANSACF
jgi:hypothetical protein